MSFARRLFVLGAIALLVGCNLKVSPHETFVNVGKHKLPTVFFEKVQLYSLKLEKNEVVYFLSPAYSKIPDLTLSGRDIIREHAMGHLKLLIDSKTKMTFVLKEIQSDSEYFRVSLNPWEY